MLKMHAMWMHDHFLNYFKLAVRLSLLPELSLEPIFHYLKNSEILTQYTRLIIEQFLSWSFSLILDLSCFILIMIVFKLITEISVFLIN